MSQYLSPLYDQLRSLVLTALPAALAVPVKQNGVWVCQHINRVPYEQLTAPYAVVQIPSLVRTHDWGAGMLQFIASANLYLVMEQRWDSLDLATNLESLRDYFETQAVISSGQVLWVQNIDWSDELDANQELTAKNMTCRAGRVTVDLLVGELGTVVHS